MTKLTLRTFPDPILRTKAKKVAVVTEVEREILAEMARVMYLSEGVGLAAIQVGIDKQLIVIDVGNGLMKLINPTIIKKEGSQAGEEGCLSVPRTCVAIRRAKKVSVDCMTENGETLRLNAEGLFARALQHEIDHLNGILIVDKIANPIKRLMLKKKISRSSRKK